MKIIVSILLLMVIITSDLYACEIKHASMLGQTNTRQTYPISLLKHLLKLTEAEFGKCELAEVGKANLRRQIAWLKDNSTIDIAWLPVTNEINKILLPIEVPISKGFLGWRLLLVDKDNVSSFKGISTLEQLKRFTAGFGASWGDLPIMQHNLSKVVTGQSYDSLFDMLLRGRFDFFPRAANEAYDEILERNKTQPALMIEPHIVLHYQEADFFYVNPTNAHLYNRIALGFKKAVSDGSFNLLFYGYFADYIEQLNMDERTIISLVNPYLPINVPIENLELWFQLDVYERLKLETAGTFGLLGKRTNH